MTNIYNRYIDEFMVPLKELCRVLNLDLDEYNEYVSGQLDEIKLSSKDRKGNYYLTYGGTYILLRHIGVSAKDSNTKLRQWFRSVI